jgi:hypothetical protein
LWNWKNKELHESNFVRPSNPVQHVIKLCDDYKKAEHTDGMVFQHNRVMTNIGWKPPKDQFVKLNVDGASNNGKQAGCGGVIRGNQGEWLGGFAKSVGDCHAIIAEFWGVLEGLRLVSRMGFTNVEVSIDSKVVV